MRQALEDKEDAKSLKQKTKERVRPKMGKLTIDYQKLHDAFFKWQTKPKMSIHGDLYYEVKMDLFSSSLTNHPHDFSLPLPHAMIELEGKRVRDSVEAEKAGRPFG